MHKLIRKVSKPDKCQDEYDDSLTLEYHDRTKSRLRVTLNSGNESGILLPRGTSLRHGDVLQTENGFTVLVEAAKETVSTVKTDDSHLLTRVCYHLGNRHVPLQIEKNWVRYLHDHVLDKMVKAMGLEVTVENGHFDPEAGAYDHGHSHQHAH